MTENSYDGKIIVQSATILLPFKVQSLENRFNVCFGVLFCAGMENFVSGGRVPLSIGSSFVNRVFLCRSLLILSQSLPPLSTGVNPFHSQASIRFILGRRQSFSGESWQTNSVSNSIVIFYLRRRLSHFFRYNPFRQNPFRHNAFRRFPRAIKESSAVEQQQFRPSPLLFRPSPLLFKSTNSSCLHIIIFSTLPLYS